MIVDITERKQVEDRLARRNQRLRLLFEATAILLTTTEPDEMLRALFDKLRPSLELDAYLNFMVTERGDEVTLVSYAGVDADDTHEVRRLAFGQGVAGTVAQQRAPLVLVDVQHSRDPLASFVRRIGMRSYTCTPLLVGDRLIGSLGFGSRRRDTYDRDELEFVQTITRYVAIAYERLRLVSQLRDQDRRKDEFLATLAHELRNPLAPIASALQLIQLAGERPEKLERARTTIERQLDHMVRLVDDLLDVSRISRNKIDLRKQQVELATIVHSAIETSRPLIDKAGHRLEIDLPRSPVILDADAVRLAQAISNLLNNAAKYSDPGRLIRLAAAREGGEVVLRVRDQGIGIPADQLDRVFDMFAQVDRSLERSQGGLGIGLTLVKRIVEMHGGRVAAHSDGPSLGTEMVIRLPCAAQLSPSAAQPAASDRAAGTRRRILIVDDNRDAADILAEMLECLGHEVATANDGLQALELAAAFQPQVAVLDIGMPHLNGYELARRLRESFAAEPLLLVAMTGWGQESDRNQSREAGFDLHLVKPVKPSTLESLIRAARPDA
jgi:signal transduction histidine kinase/ActR/RegA family two-component response regulator